ncbi:MAG TPA: adenylate/guanylate cyclase domain-containing protein [Solirubrobacter sp.]|nr:adenylate/guanylate cyclase domain-containing protein [Solirubrobacter sp.]
MTRRRVLGCVLATLLAIGAGLAVDATEMLQRLELRSVDARFSVRGTQDPRPDVVIVGIDDKTLDAGEGAFLPLDRARHAKVIEQLTKAGAGTILYGVQFTSPGPDTDEAIEADNALVEAVRAAPKIVMATNQPGPEGDVFGGGEAYAYTESTAANSQFPLDSDGRVRKMPFRLNGLDNMALAAARLHAGVQRPSGNEAWIDFPGPPGTIPELSFVDVENGRFDAADVRGRVVVVGSTALRAGDVHGTSTSRDRRMSKPEITAAATATALAGFPLDEGAGWIGVLAIVLLALAAPVAALRLRATVALAVGLAAAAAYAIVVQLAFNAGTILPLMPQLAAAAVATVGAVIAAQPARAEWVDRALDRVSGRRGNQRTRRLRALLLLCGALGIAAVTLVADAANALRTLDNSTVDRRFRIRGPVPPPTDVVVVGIDDKTLATPGVQYPVARAMQAQVIENLAKAGAGVIAYDLEVSEPSDDAKGDAAFIEAVRDASNVVLATTDVFPLSSTQVLAFGNGLAYSRGQPALAQVIEDADGRVRRMPFSFEGLPLFSLVAAERLRGQPVELPPGDDAWIPYAGPEYTLKFVSYIDVVEGNFKPADVRGKAVVVGAAQSSLQDLHHTSTTTNFRMPGPEIQATMISTALRGFPLHSAPWWLDALLVFALAAVAPLVALRRGIVVAVAAGVVAIALFGVAAQLAFERSDLILSVAYPVLAGIAAILLTAAIHGLTVAFEREQARDAFARFVPETVVDQVLADAEGVRLGGVRREGTVMFSDLRGFTSFSETLEPERVIEALNRYLTEMSEAILDHGGTLVAYMGDGIMAVFGAPLQQDDHADRALEAAREMLQRLERFNQWLRDQGLHEGFKMGIGLNSGPVMSGNVGSERRLEYTALGDTTNTAARLEGMTKGTPHQLYISDTTKQRLTRAADDLVAVGEAEVRGRKAKVLLWSLRDEPAPKPAPATERPARAAQS